MDKLLFLVSLALLLLGSCTQKISADSPGTNVEDEQGDASWENEDGSIEFTDIVGFDEFCSGKSICDKKVQQLVCSDKGKCQCDLGMRYSKMLSKCIQSTESVSGEKEGGKGVSITPRKEGEVEDSTSEEGSSEETEKSGEVVGPKSEDLKKHEEIVPVTEPTVQNNVEVTQKEEKPREDDSSDEDEGWIDMDDNFWNTSPPTLVSASTSVPETAQTTVKITISTSKTPEEAKPPGHDHKHHDHHEDKDMDKNKDTFWKEGEEIKFDGDWDDEDGWIVKDKDDAGSSSRSGTPTTGDVSCTEDSQCQSGRMGPYAMCFKESETCVCQPKDEDLGRSIALMNGTCSLLKQINDPCISHAECDLGIQGGGWCHFDLVTKHSSCVCRPLTHFWDEEYKECLGIASSAGLSFECKKDAQCNADDALGAYSRCGFDNHCECYNPYSTAENPDSRELIYFEGRCVLERDVEEACRTDQECQASLGPYALCNPDTNACGCVEGGSCTKGYFRRFSLERPQMSSFTMTVLILIGVAILLGGVVCIVFKTREKARYNFVSQNPV